MASYLLLDELLALLLVIHVLFICDLGSEGGGIAAGIASAIRAFTSSESDCRGKRQTY